MTYGPEGFICNPELASSLFTGLPPASSSASIAETSESESIAFGLFSPLCSARRINPAALLVHVLHIVGLRSSKQVVRSNARRGYRTDEAQTFLKEFLHK